MKNLSFPWNWSWTDLLLSALLLGGIIGAFFSAANAQVIVRSYTDDITSCSGELYQFGISSLFPEDGFEPSDAQADWSWGDGSETRNVFNPTHAWARPGGYRIEVTVTHRDGTVAKWGRHLVVDPITSEQCRYLLELEPEEEVEPTPPASQEESGSAIYYGAGLIGGGGLAEVLAGYSEATTPSCLPCGGTAPPEAIEGTPFFGVLVLTLSVPLGDGHSLGLAGGPAIGGIEGLSSPLFGGYGGAFYSFGGRIRLLISGGVAFFPREGEGNLVPAITGGIGF